MKRENEIFKRIFERLRKLPGRLESGRTSDTGNPYVSWYPQDDTGVYIRFLSVYDSIDIDSNLTCAGNISIDVEETVYVLGIATPDSFEETGRTDSRSVADSWVLQSSGIEDTMHAYGIRKIPKIE